MNNIIYTARFGVGTTIGNIGQAIKQHRVCLKIAVICRGVLLPKTANRAKLVSDKWPKAPSGHLLDTSLTLSAVSDTSTAIRITTKRQVPQPRLQGGKWIGQKTLYGISHLKMSPTHVPTQ